MGYMHIPNLYRSQEIIMFRECYALEHWLAVPQAHDVATKLGVEFVHYVKVSTDLDALNAERDAPSEQAKRNGVEGEQTREGVVLRPLIEGAGEFTDSREARAAIGRKTAEVFKERLKASLEARHGD